MSGCREDSQLCDANVLIHHVQQFATRAMDCSVPEKSRSSVLAAMKSLLGNSEGLLLVLLVVVIGAVLGAVIMFVFVIGTLPTKKGLEVLEERREREQDREATRGLMNEEIELTFAADADSPFDESRLD
jgi:Na+/H+-translocating membrane pyrophosphatase